MIDRAMKAVGIPGAGFDADSPSSMSAKGYGKKGVT
jgi:hypothetical protein